MSSLFIWIGISVGIFLIGLGIGYTIFSNTNTQPYMMMQNPQAFNQMIQNPQFANMWMNNMMSNPQAMNTWMNAMIENPQFMNQWMSSMLTNSKFQQQYMGSWMMVQDPRYMSNMMKLFSIPQKSPGSYAYPIVKTDQVSIVNGAWQINTTQSYSPTIIEVISGTTVTWTNDDSVVHTVTSLNGTFDSHLILPASTWKYTFYNEGKYNYFCTLHPWMKGLVIVS